MARVWIVTEGEYSNYHIVGVCSSEEKARAFFPKKAEEDQGSGSNHSTIPGISGSWAILEMELDALPELQIRVVYMASVALNTGDVNERYCYPRMAGTPPDWSGGSWATGWDHCYGYSTVSKEHAIKVAIETRQAALRGSETDRANEMMDD